MRSLGVIKPKWYVAAFVFFLFVSSDLQSTTLKEFDKEITDLVHGVQASVVTIHTYHKYPADSDKGRSFPFVPEYIDTQIGTGVVYDSNGHVITTCHVVAGGNRFEVFSRDGRKFEAVLVGVNPDADLSVLQITSGQLPALAIDLTKPVIAGSLLFVIGNSFGIPNAANLATAVGYKSDGSLLVSANLAPGFSGGPVINTSGKMVGLISAKLTEPVVLNSMKLYRKSPTGQKVWDFQRAEMELPSTGVILALSASDVKNKADQLIAGEHTRRGFLGIRVQNMDPDWMQKAFNVKSGVMIADVLENSPARKAGIRPGDILTRYLSRQIENSNQLYKLIASNRQGDIVSLMVVRGGRNLRFTVRLTSQEAINIINVTNPEPSLQDIINEEPEAELAIDPDYKRTLGERIRQLKCDMLKQMDQLNALQRELDRLMSEDKKNNQ